MFIGSGLMRVRGLRFERAHEGDAVAGERFGSAPSSKSTVDARIAVVWTRWPKPGSRCFRGVAFSTTRLRGGLGDVEPSRAAIASPSAISSMQSDPAPPCSSPIVRTPAATAAESDCRLPEAASRAAAHDGAPAP